MLLLKCCTQYASKFGKLNSDHRTGLQSLQTLCNLMDCRLPGSSVHGISQARVAMPSSRGSFWPWDWTIISYVSCIGRSILYHYSHLGNPPLNIDLMHRTWIKIFVKYLNIWAPYNQIPDYDLPIFLYNFVENCAFFFSFVFISWRLITLQYCSGFCHTLTWISHGVTCVPHPEPPSHLPPHSIPLGHPSTPAPSTCRMHPTWTGDLFHTW